MKIVLAISLAVLSLPLAGCRSGADRAQATQAAFARLHHQHEVEADKLRIKDDQLQIQIAIGQHRTPDRFALQKDLAKLQADETVVQNHEADSHK